MIIKIVFMTDVGRRDILVRAYTLRSFCTNEERVIEIELVLLAASSVTRKIT